MNVLSILNCLFRRPLGGTFILFVAVFIFISVGIAQTQEGAAGTSTQQTGEAQKSEGEPPVQKKGAESTRIEQTSPQKITHEFKGVKATSDVVSGVLAGGAVLLELSKPLQQDSKPVIELIPVAPDDSSAVSQIPAEKPESKMEVQGYLNGNIVATVPEKTKPGLYEVKLKLSGEQVVEIQRPQRLKVHSIAWIISIALAPLILLALILWLLLRYYRRAQNIQRRSIWALLLLEPENQTYSLSRAQFVLWSVAIVWAYVFIFVATGIVQNVWTFPPLEGFAMTFLISLGTLLTAQATSAAKGAKGAGQFQPSPADLVMHGGVLALERVQQVLWTITAVGMFIVIVYKQYAIATKPPVIPEELLILMGISSAGYLGGKFARKAGPIIDKVRAAAGSVVLTIRGKQLSKEALIWVDGTRLEDKPSVLLSDPDRNEFARELQVKLMTIDAPTWFGQERSVVVVNTDGQRAEWQSEPLIETATLQSVADGYELLVKGHYLGAGTTWEMTGDASVTETPKPDTTEPQTWHIPVKITGELSTARGKITAQTTRGRRTSTDWLLELKK